MKAINYKMKTMNRFVFFRRKASRPAIIQNMSYIYKYDKSQKVISFFLWKTRVEASKVITNSLKTLDFVTPIPFDTFLDKNNVIFNLW